MSDRDIESLGDELSTNSKMLDRDEQGNVADQNQRTRDEPVHHELEICNHQLNSSNRQVVTEASHEMGNCQDQTQHDQLVHDELEVLSADRRRRDLQHIRNSRLDNDHEQLARDKLDTMGRQRNPNTTVLSGEPMDLGRCNEEQPSRQQPAFSGRNSKLYIGLTPGGPLPGAYSIQNRASGGRPIWAQQGRTPPLDNTLPSSTGPAMPPLLYSSTRILPAEEENYESSINFEANLDEENQTQSSTDNTRNCFNWNRTCLLTILLFAFGLISITGGLILNRPTGSAPATNDVNTPCSLSEPQPNVQTQCDCFGKIEKLSEATKLQYGLLQATLGLDIIPHEDSSSCDAHNVAVLLLSSMNTSAMSHHQLLDRYVLNLFYLSSGGPKSWKRNDGWLNEERNVCTWHGVECDSDRITKLDLFNNGINGTLVSELGLLDSLTYLKLSKNDLLSGAIPSEVGRLNGMVLLELEATNVGKEPTNSAIQYAMPSEIGLLPGLESLGFPPFVLVAPLPTEFGNLRALTSLEILATAIPSAPYYFGGPLPIWDAPHLRHLYAPSCLFSGAIPGNKLGMMTGLTYLNLLGNQLTNTIPSELGLLSKHWRVFSASRAIFDVQRP
jgi:hypothetical protein